MENKTLFCDLGSDGMTVDADGNVYLTGRGVTVFDKTGKKLTNIPIPRLIHLVLGMEWRSLRSGGLYLTLPESRRAVVLAVP